MMRLSSHHKCGLVSRRCGGSRGGGGLRQHTRSSRRLALSASSNDGAAEADSALASPGPAPGPSLDLPVTADTPALPGDPRLVGSPLAEDSYDDQLTLEALRAAPGNITEDSTLQETIVSFGFTLAIGILLVVTLGVGYLSVRDFLDKQEQEKGRKALEREMRERALKAGDQPLDTKRPSERGDFRGFGE